MKKERRLTEEEREKIHEKWQRPHFPIKHEGNGVSKPLACIAIIIGILFPLAGLLISVFSLCFKGKSKSETILGFVGVLSSIVMWAIYYFFLIQ
jgi:hypothetical protein